MASFKLDDGIKKFADDLINLYMFFAEIFSQFAV